VGKTSMEINVITVGKWSKNALLTCLSRKAVNTMQCVTLLYARLQFDLQN